MKKKVTVILAVAAGLAVALYFVLPGLAVKWVRQSERKSAGLEEKNVRVGDHEIVYLEGGQGETILMVHGFTANKDNWTRFAKSITPAYHVVALDLPGFGDSTYLEQASYSVMDQAKRLDQFVNAIDLKKFHIVGNSMGGHIAGRYAVMFPDKVITLGLFNASGVTSPEQSELAKMLAKGDPNPLIVGSAEDFDRMLKFVFVTPPVVPGFAKKVLVDQAVRHRAGNQRISKEGAAERAALEPDLPKIKARTFVLWGDKDRLLDVSSVKPFEKGLANCATVIMKDCGHVPMIERPEEAAKHYLTFLKGK
ncbi:MAG: alpha/beta hydrolase [Thermodesulfobacteriota bacterium]